MRRFTERDIAKALSYKRGYRIYEAIDIVDDVLDIIKNILLDGNVVLLTNFLRLQALDTNRGVQLHCKKAHMFANEINRKQSEGANFERRKPNRNKY